MSGHDEDARTAAREDQARRRRSAVSMLPAALAATLDLGVPLEIARLRDADVDQLRDAAARAADIVQRAESSIEMRSGSTGRTVAGLIQALGVLAYAMGGVDAFGRHWCVDHQACLDAQQVTP